MKRGGGRTVSLRGPAAAAFMNASRALLEGKEAEQTEEQMYQAIAVFVTLEVKRGTAEGMARAVGALRRLREAGAQWGAQHVTQVRPLHLPECQAHDNDYGDEGDRWTCAPGCPVERR